MKVLGLGNALTDVLAMLPSEECIAEIGLLKGGMQLIDEDKLLKIMSVFEDFDTVLATGGSAANAISGLTRMGLPGGFIGKTGPDSYGKFYHDDMEKNGDELHLLERNTASGCAMTMITPDGERTFGTYLGAASALIPGELHPGMFAGYDLLHIEGYLVQDPELIRRAVELAKNAGLKISLDMASYNIVNENLEFFHELVRDYVDIAFANEEEAFAYTGKEPEEAVKEIASECDIAVVKCGKLGSIVQKRDEIARIGSTPTKCIDSTGAGDLYAAGFLYGLSKNYSLKVSGSIGAVLSGNVIEVIGTKMDDNRWNQIKLKVKRIVENNETL